MTIERTLVSSHPATIALMILIVVACPKTAIVAHAQQWGTNGSHIYNTNSGNVGIGTTAPGSLLHVYGTNSKITMDAPIGSGNGTGGIRFTTAGTENAHLGLYSGLHNSTNTGVEFDVPNNLYITSGNVGIGTTNPQYKIDVQGAGSTIARFLGGSGMGSGITLGSSGATQWILGPGMGTLSNASDFALYDSTNSNTALVVKAAQGNVGIGTTAPGSLLHVYGINSKITMDAPIGSGNGTGGIRFTTAGTENAHLGLYSGLHNSTNTGVEFDVPNNLYITSGNVGIGTTTPATRLHVAGDVTVTGSISAKYQDLAEWVPAAQPIAPGTVVILDPGHTNGVMPAFKAYDTRVAGVVSANPGIMLGEAAQGDVKVATTGRVRVRADATIAPIRTGDLLVTSDREGFAMKSEPIDVAGVQIHRPGTLLGKALESLQQGEGEILVLLSLQ